MYQNCWLQASEIVEKKNIHQFLGLNNLDPSPSHETSWSAADHPTSGCAAVFPDEPGTGNSWYSTILQERTAKENATNAKEVSFEHPRSQKILQVPRWITLGPRRGHVWTPLCSPVPGWIVDTPASCGWHVCENGEVTPKWPVHLGIIGDHDQPLWSCWYTTLSDKLWFWRRRKRWYVSEKNTSTHIAAESEKDAKLIWGIRQFQAATAPGGRQTSRWPALPLLHKMLIQCLSSKMAFWSEGVGS